MKFVPIFGTAIAMVLMVGCAHTHSVQGVEQQDSERAVRVAIGSEEIREGEKVNVFRSVCRDVSRGKAGTMTTCKDDKIGEALVLKVLDRNSAIVVPERGLTMDTGMTVERVQAQ